MCWGLRRFDCFNYVRFDFGQGKCYIIQGKVRENSRVFATESRGKSGKLFSGKEYEPCISHCDHVITILEDMKHDNTNICASSNSFSCINISCFGPHRHKFSFTFLGTVRKISHCNETEQVLSLDAPHAA